MTNKMDLDPDFKNKLDAFWDEECQNDLCWWFAIPSKNEDQWYCDDGEGIFSCTDSLQYAGVALNLTGKYGQVVLEDYPDCFYIGILYRELPELRPINLLEKKYGMRRTEIACHYKTPDMENYATVLRISKQWVRSNLLLHTFGWVLRSSLFVYANSDTSKYFSKKEREELAVKLARKYTWNMYLRTVCDFCNRVGEHNVLGSGDIEYYLDEDFEKNIDILLSNRNIFSISSKKYRNMLAEDESDEGESYNGRIDVPSQGFKSYMGIMGGGRISVGPILSKMVDTYRLREARRK